VGCKGDLEAERKISDAEAADWATEKHAEYILTSAKTDSNLGEAFVGAVRSLARWRDAMNAAAAENAKISNRTQSKCVCQ
jgi:hypothetical protein